MAENTIRILQLEDSEEDAELRRAELRRAGLRFEWRREQTAGRSEAVAAPVTSLRGSETVLVVDDDPEVRNLIRRILLAQGYTVLAAAGGEEALRICREHEGRIHLLASDVVMPKMRGGDLARAVLKTRPEAKVLFISGHADGLTAPQGVFDPGFHFLQKPFTREGLTRRVREVLAAKP